jgi:hypothetical protein
MPVVITLNNPKYYDAIRISKQNECICIEYAYYVPLKSTSPVYEYSSTFSNVEDVQEYMKRLDDILCADLEKPSTIDVQLDGFPCAKLNTANFMNMIRDGSLYKSIAMSLRFTKG